MRFRVFSASGAVSVKGFRLVYISYYQKRVTKAKLKKREMTKIKELSRPFAFLNFLQSYIQHILKSYKSSLKPKLAKLMQLFICKSKMIIYINLIICYLQNILSEGGKVLTL